ncbi:MAG: flagellar assembly peptidoglycan hydrolase FlgJ [Gammaproteobacteria bacterium]|nr:flagellar assembly peptidoglycan hydrolase FlgJ [Gammaproteobacteria bacterium]
MTASLDPTIYTDPQGLAQLRAKARAEGGDRSPETLRTVAGQFEALFVQMMLKNMRAASLGEGAFDSEQTQFYQGMFDQQIALELSRGKGLGIADVLVRQLGGTGAAGEHERPALNTDPFVGPVAPRRRPSAAVQGGTDAGRTEAAAAPAVRDWRPASCDEFVTDIWPHAEQAARRLGVDPRAIVAQAALETGWGQHIMHHSDGRSSHNLFGIKADNRWSGPQVGARTLEFRDGALQREQASFRAYASPAESVADYAEFIAANPRYRDALATGDAARYLEELQRAGYATDPDYANKIMSILNQDDFRAAVDAAQHRSPVAAKPGEAVITLNTQASPLTFLKPADTAADRGGEL